jgi:hypothetical protein
MQKQYFGCAGCGERTGTDGDYNYCMHCSSYKYFGWITCDCGECETHE